ncbi:lamin tail domain-containing protein [Fodinibius sp. Rm-B-1B1-1]|uniref:lamin tail domain-containing protein n=1 Tax=Fodinibius alkaliphilus TaxID=3140241 RepID=UPI00315AC647
MAVFLVGIAFQEGYAQTTLTSGDLTIVTANADDDKKFDFVPLVDLETGTEIYFTDVPYIESLGSLDSESREGVLKYTTQAKVDAGSIVSYSGSDGNGFEQISGNFAPLVSGDNIISYQADTDTTFLYGIGWARGSSWDYNEGSNTSDIPPNLSTTANTILNLGTTDNYQYAVGSGTAGTANTLLALIGDEQNWIDNDTNAFSPFDSDFTLLDPPTIAFTSEKTTGGEGSTVDIEIELVEANGEAVDVEVAFVSDASTATNGEDFATYATQTVNFSDTDTDGTIKSIAINLTDDSDFEGSEKAVFQLQNNSTGAIISPSTTTLTIEDNDTPRIVINEIHADPDPNNGDADGNDNVSSSDDEFVEFVNNTSSDIDISNWTFSDESGLRHTFPAGTSIPAEGSLVLFADDEINPKGNFGGTIVQGSNESPTLSLNNGGDTIYLHDTDGNEVLSLTYSAADNDQSIVRDPEITGDFVAHSSVSDNDELYSPGTKVDGTAFGSKYAMGIRGSAGWRLLSTPTKNTSFKDLLGDIWIQGIQGSDHDGAQFKNLMGWDEANKTFTPPSSVDDNLVPGRGYAVYVYEDDDARASGIQGGFPKLVNTNHTDGTENVENDSPVTVNVTANDADGSGSIDGTEEGWNLLGNPFGTDISVDALFLALENANSNVNTNIAVWDHDKSGGPGYVQLKKGDQERLAPFQAFWVRYNTDGIDADVTLNKEDLAVNQGTNFIKSASSEEFEFSIGLHGEQGYFDTFKLVFSEDGNTDLNRYDAYQLTSLDVHSINLYSVISNNRITTKELPVELENAMEFPLSFSANDRDQLTFRWDVDSDIPNGWSIKLIDQESGREIDMNNSREYQFTVNAKSQTKTGEEENLLHKDTGEEKKPRFVLSIDPNIGLTNSSEIPESVKLNPNYPNPFTNSTTIPFELTEQADVTLTVWNMIGQKVATLVDGVRSPDDDNAPRWDASSMPSGIYIARFEVNGNVFTRKMTLIK